MSMNWHKIELKQFAIVSFASHLLLMGFFTVYNPHSEKKIFIPLSFNLNPQGTGRAGSEAARGRYVAPKAKAAKVMPIKSPSKIVRTDITSTKQAAVSRVALPVQEGSVSDGTGHQY